MEERFIMQFIKNFIREEDGQDVIEYALVLGLVALAGAAGLAIIGGQVDGLMTATQDALTAAGAPAPAAG
jgi:pilus assembly protein Flp/PilA